MYGTRFNIIVNELINDIENKEKDNINKCAKICLDAILNNKVIHVFATGHSHMFGEELFYRAGGIAQIDPILKPFLMQHEGAISSTKFERLEGIASIIYNGLDLEEGEPFIIVSNSGVNNVPVEMSNIAKDNHHPVIVVTSLETSKKIDAKNTLGKHLYEIGDVVIDNHVPYGDVSIDTKSGKCGAISTIANSYIAQRIVLDIISLSEESNINLPIFESANTGGDNHNLELVEKYHKRIKGLN